MICKAGKNEESIQKAAGLNKERIQGQSGKKKVLFRNSEVRMGKDEASIQAGRCIYHQRQYKPSIGKEGGVR